MDCFWLVEHLEFFIKSTVSKERYAWTPFCLCLFAFSPQDLPERFQILSFTLQYPHHPLFWRFPKSKTSPRPDSGIRKNLLTGYISDQAERGGIHFVGPLKTFFTVPAAQGTLQWSWSGGDRAPVQTRTGADPQDPDSGGQPISISCAVQAVWGTGPWKTGHDMVDRI